jgi:hypothetical protein
MLSDNDTRMALINSGHIIGSSNTMLIWRLYIDFIGHHAIRTDIHPKEKIALRNR